MTPISLLQVNNTFKMDENIFLRFSALSLTFSIGQSASSFSDSRNAQRHAQIIEFPLVEYQHFSVCISSSFLSAALFDEYSSVLRHEHVYDVLFCRFFFSFKKIFTKMTSNNIISSWSFCRMTTESRWAVEQFVSRWLQDNWESEKLIFNQRIDKELHVSCIRANTLGYSSRIIWCRRLDGNNQFLLFCYSTMFTSRKLLVLI